MLRSQVRSAGNARRLQQAHGYVWFLEVAKRCAPDLEFFAMPGGTGFPFLMRPKTGLRATDGSWVGMQIRNTVRAACDMPGRPGILCRMRNASISQWWRDAPYLVTSPARNSIFVFKDRVVGSVRLESTARIDMTEADGAAELRKRLMDLHEHYAAKAKPLFEHMQTAAPNAIVQHRCDMIAQLMQLPVFEEIVFPAVYGAGDVRANALLRGVKTVLRRSYLTHSAAGIQTSMTKVVAGVNVPFDTSDDIELFIWLVPARRNPAKLHYIGLIPQEAIVRRGIILSDSERNGVRYPYFRWKSDEGLAFDRRQSQGLEPYFIRADAAPAAMHKFTERILTEVSSHKHPPKDPTKKHTILVTESGPFL
ncbi:unnamed protein product [Amoebophrya sp. A120]|nr:unnamed protein product [Amoebophrya sp. A120]|eukprot:GSA120T00001090001.1